MTTKIYGLAFEMGEIRDSINAVLDVTAEDLQKLHPDVSGLKYFRQSTRNIYQLAVKSVQMSFSLAGIDASSVGAIIFVTSSFLETPEQRAKLLGGMMKELGLVNAFPFTISSSDCANFHAALQMADSLIQQQRYSRIVIVCADVGKAYLSRVITPGIAIASDGAASCVVSEAAAGRGFEICRTALKTNLELVLAADHRSKSLNEFILGVKDVCRSAMSGLKPGQIKKLITNNYAKSMLQAYALLSGLGEDKLYLANLQDIGHCFAADNIINLSGYLAESNAATNGDFVMTLGTGSGHWGATLLRLTEAG